MPADSLDRDLGGGYLLRPVAPDEFEAVYARREPELFSGQVYDWSDLPRVPQPEAQVMTFFLLRGGEFAGLHRARQRDAYTVNMSVTGLLPAHRGQGVYTRLLPPLLELYRAAGYTFVTSHHHPTNNAVLIPKLRAGFVIQGMQMARAGLMVELLYSFDQNYRDYLERLCGHQAAATNETPQGEPHP
ncbi:GNAT family N-acetyltransferase [Deinococcus radiophilus]|uniref:N-acetyltransferase n=1 Tax=Deinococcus radiophilus TaxID=32062 RepID=A0A431W226_9DEIO|nr:GNAT family N-acetyltransferase [Deinococcus radiophilus]RTR29488.1 N-acetyltransferase [Deinococcus radiophilus]UFA50677.1 GNAT family N-acetyltransferase [Deinococcus radiophilus]